MILKYGKCYIVLLNNMINQIVNCVINGFTCWKH